LNWTLPKCNWINSVTSSQTEAIKTIQKGKKFLLIPSLNIIPASFHTAFASLVQWIECPRKHFFPYRLKFYCHCLLDQWNSLKSHPFDLSF
jgi:hypothetical protein